MAQTFSNKGYTVALGLFVAVLAVYAVFQSPLFQLQKIDLVGGERLSASDILTWTGLTLGQNLFDLDTTAIAEELRRHPMVADAQVRRKLPASLEVHVDERQPVAFVSIGDSFWAVDAEAIALFESVGLTLPLPLVTLDADLEPVAGARIEHSRLPTALEFAAGLSVKVLAGLSEVHVTGDGVTAVHPRRHLDLPGQRRPDGREGARVGGPPRPGASAPALRRPHRPPAPQEPGF